MPRIIAVFLIVILELFAAVSWAGAPKSYRQKFIDDNDFFARQDAMRRQSTAESLVESKNLTAQEAVLFQQAPLGQQVNQIYLWFSQNQQASPLGLIASYPDDTGFIYHEGIQQEWAKIYGNTQAYTYDQALAGITMLKHGDAAGAKKIFDFYYSQWQAESGNFTGFWTVYNVDPAFQWKRYEWRKGMGESAWMALFSLQYYSAQQEAAERQKALELATQIAKWIGTLPNHNGAAAMSPDTPGGAPNFGTIYAVENNFDYYSLLKTLSTEASSQQDRQSFTANLNALKNWLKTEAYDSSSDEFKRGGQFDSGTNQFVWDTTKGLDGQSWAIAAIGISTLVNDFGVNMDDFVARIHETYAVQEDGSFGGDIFQAKGFDFSDASNAGAIGRSGMKWVEGTNQMILAYEMLADFYSQDPTKASYYRSLSDYFLGRNAENAVEMNGSLSYLYADQSDVQIYEGTPNWRTTPGPAAPSAAWAYFSLNGINPFESFQNESPNRPFSVSASTSAAASTLGLKNLTINVEEGNQATVRFENRVYNGIFDATGQAIHLDNIQNSPPILSESWNIGFEAVLTGGTSAYFLTSFEKSLTYPDNRLYDYTYHFTPDGLLASDIFEESFDNHTSSQTTLYDYAEALGKPFVESTTTAAFFDGQYGYGHEIHYAYDVDANGDPLTLITVTQETRNNPLFRALESYQIVIHDNGFIEMISLGTQTTPF